MGYRPARLGAVVLLVISLFIGPASAEPSVSHFGCDDELAWNELVESHLTRYPLMEMTDLYKLLHQATMGSEHAVPNREVPAEWLARELAEMGDGPVEPVVDTLGVGGRIVRIHLRPFVASGGEPDRLLDAFVATANSEGDREALLCSFGGALSVTRESVVPWSELELKGFLAARAEEGYPAAHHSDGFVAAYRPAYRVISVDLVPAVLGGTFLP